MVEYVFASSVTDADQVARKRGWRPWGRAAWHKSDGTVVYYIFFAGNLLTFRLARKFISFTTPPN